MTDLDSTDPRDTPEELPGLARDLGLIARTGIETSAERENRFRAEIHRHFRESASRAARPSRTPWMTWRSAAAVFVLVVTAWLASMWLASGSSNSSAPAGMPGPGSPSVVATRDTADIDRNGRVDILDALALARRLETGAEPDPGLDLNGDGAVDGRDVDAIAARAVTLSGRTG